MPEKAWDRRSYGDFRVDVRLCNGRKGFPHVGTDELDPGERERVRARLLGTIQAAVKEGVLSREDLGVLAGSPGVTDRYQMVMALPVSVGESIRVQAGESIRVRVREEI